MTNPHDPSELPDGSTVLGQFMSRGDQAALAKLFERYRPRLVRIVGYRLDRRLWGRVDPEDVVQEGFLDGARRQHHLAEKPFEKPFLWWRLIILQTLADVQRRHLGTKGRDPGREVKRKAPASASETGVSLAALLVDQGRSPSSAVGQQELIAQISEQVADMEEIDRTVLTLRHFEELSNKETAEVLGIDAKAASVRYVRALRRLRARLEKLPSFAGTMRHEADAAD